MGHLSIVASSSQTRHSPVSRFRPENGVKYSLVIFGEHVTSIGDKRRNNKQANAIFFNWMRNCKKKCFPTHAIFLEKRIRETFHGYLQMDVY